MNTMKTTVKPELVIGSSLILLLILLAMVLMFSGCMYERIEGNYDLVTEERQATAFDEVISSGDFRVIVSPNDAATIQVKAESNILPYIYTVYNGTTLRIGYRNGYNIQENYPVEVILSTPDIKAIRLQGSGRVECEGFKPSTIDLFISGSGSMDCDFTALALNADISGSGTMRLSGSAATASFGISGSGNVRAHDLQTEKCFATISGSGDIYTTVEDYLDARISGSGDIWYSGDPEVKSVISGSGSVKRY